jgi:hypothetical protein
VAAIEDILHLGRMSQYDYFSRSLTDMFSTRPDLAPYDAIKPAQRLDELNAATAPGAEESKTFNLTAADKIDDGTFNRVLWRLIKGDTAAMPKPIYSSPTHQIRMGN